MTDNTDPHTAEAVAEFWTAARRALPELPPAVPIVVERFRLRYPLS
ncbi:hypothetical protein [Leucobacter sp. OH1287]|nr:hypothetical protein [Leucobacter sp. OH1287]